MSTEKNNEPRLIALLSQLESEVTTFRKINIEISTKLNEVHRVNFTEPESAQEELPEPKAILDSIFNAIALLKVENERLQLSYSHLKTII